MEGATADFDRSISLDPRNPLAYADRGLALLHQGKEDEAQKDFDKSMKLNSELKLFLELHIMELEMQIREMRRREAAIQQKIA